MAPMSTGRNVACHGRAFTSQVALIAAGVARRSLRRSLQRDASGRCAAGRLPPCGAAALALRARIGAELANELGHFVGLVCQ